MPDKIDTQYVLDNRKPEWNSPNNRVLVYGRGNTFKTMIALKLLFYAALKALRDTAIPVNIHILSCECNIDAQTVALALGEKDETAKSFFTRTSAMGIGFRIVTPVGGVYEALAAVARYQDPKQFMLVDGVSELASTMDFESLTVAPVQAFRQLVKSCHGLVIATTHASNRIIQPGDDGSPVPGPLRIAGGNSLLSEFGLAMQTHVDKNDHYTGNVTVTQGPKAVLGESLSFDFSYLRQPG